MVMNMFISAIRLFQLNLLNVEMLRVCPLTIGTTYSYVEMTVIYVYFNDLFLGH